MTADNRKPDPLSPAAPRAERPTAVRVLRADAASTPMTAGSDTGSEVGRQRFQPLMSPPLIQCRPATHRSAFQSLQQSPRAESPEIPAVPRGVVLSAMMTYQTTVTEIAPGSGLSRGPIILSPENDAPFADVDSESIPVMPSSAVMMATMS